MRPAKLWAVVLLAALVAPATAQQEVTVIDRILAVVDEDPILQSEVDQVIGLDLIERQTEEPDEEYQRRVLTRLIDQRLRFHEIDRFGFSELPIDEVERQFSGFRERLGGGDRFVERLAELGLDETSLKQLVARQIMVVTYVEERLGPRVFVGIDDITAYYDDVLTTEMAATGQPLPPIQEVREQIRDVVKQQRLNEEIGRWTEELRQKADIEDYSLSGRDTLPAHLLSDG
jgi:parvulin-like peptidyl-prolyl isomerase